jgi:hypothetical protein
MNASALVARWRRRDRTFERALGRYLASPLLFTLPGLLWFLRLALAADAPPQAALVFIAFIIPIIATIVWLLRWFGGGRFLLGLWLWVLSWGLIGSLAVLVGMAAALLRGQLAALKDLAGGALVTVCAAGLFLACWYALKLAEARV